jgi:U3 small nucleolar RNA-associated protein 20
MLPVFLHLSTIPICSAAPSTTFVLHCSHSYQHQSYAKSLKEVHLPSALSQTLLDNDLELSAALQSIVLSCILSYKFPCLAPFEPQMRAFLNDTRWWDELSRLELSEVEPQARGEVVEVITRLLFGLMLEKKGRSRGADRRAAILGALAGCTDEELGLVVDLMLWSFKGDRTSHQEQPFSIHEVSADISEKQQIGFIGLLRDVIRHLGPGLVQYWPVLLGMTMDFVARAQARITSPGQANEDDEIDAEEEEDIEDASPSSASKILHTIRQHGLKHLIIPHFPTS